MSMSGYKYSPALGWLSTMLASVFLSVCAAGQTWNYSHVEYIEEEIPLFKIIEQTQANGFYDHGNGMTIKSVIFELGRCSKGHPCAVSTGLSQLYPDGCPSTCAERFPGDPFLTYDVQCKNYITADNSTFLQEHYGNLTMLVAEWLELYDTDCLLNYDFFADEWLHENEGVAIVTRAKGFTFPAQTIIVSDIDSQASEEGFIWPDVVQEVSTNFAIVGEQVLRPRNEYAVQRYSAVDLADVDVVVAEINVTLTRSLLEGLQLPGEATWMPATMSAMSSDLVGALPEWRYPEFAREVMGGMVWARFDSAFDTLVQTLTLGNKYSMDADQLVELYPIKVRARCRCSSSSQISVITRPIGGARVWCTTQVMSTTRYECDGSGEYYCNLVRMTGWHRTGVERSDGAVECEARNQTKVRYEMAVADVAEAEWSWPSV